MRGFRFAKSGFFTRILICLVLVLLFAIVGEWFYLSHTSSSGRSHSPARLAEMDTCPPPVMKMMECPKCVDQASNASPPPPPSSPTVPPVDVTTEDLTLWKKQGESFWSSMAFGAIVNGERNSHLCEPWTSVLEYGAGGGHHLNALTCGGGKLGVEPNPHSRKYAADHFGLPMVRDLDEVGRFFDLIVNSGVEFLEAECPVCEIRKMRRVLADRGMVVLSVPADGHRGDYDIYKPSARTNRIRSLTPHSLGDMMEMGGILVCECFAEYGAWASQDNKDYEENRCDWCRRTQAAGKKKPNDSKYSVCLGVKSMKQCFDGRNRMEVMKNCQHVCTTPSKWVY